MVAAAEHMHAGGASYSAIRTRLGGGDRRGWYVYIYSPDMDIHKLGSDNNGGPCFRAIEQDGDNRGSIHVDIGSYADAVFAKE